MNIFCGLHPIFLEKSKQNRLFAGVFSVLLIVLMMIYPYNLSAHDPGVIKPPPPKKRIKKASTSPRCHETYRTTPKKTVMLRPRIKTRPLPFVSPYPKNLLEPFFKDSLILCGRACFNCAPKVVGLDKERADAGKGDFLYVRGIETVKDRIYNVYRRGRNYFHPVTKECLGFEAKLIGTAGLTVLCPVSELEVLTASEGIVIGDRVLPSESLPPYPNFIASPAITPAEGFILSIRDGDKFAGKHDVVVISLGEREGLVPGNLLDIYQVNRRRTTCEPCPCPPRLPDLKVGRLLVFRTYEKLSLALIVEAKEIINLLDRVRSPFDTNVCPVCPLPPPPPQPCPVPCRPCS